MSNKGNVASWSDPKAKKESLAKGRERAYKTRREKEGSSFGKGQIESIRLAKYQEHGNHLAVYLLTKGIDTTELKRTMQRLNRPDNFAKEQSFNKAVRQIVELSNKQKENTITEEVVLELIKQGIESRALGKKPTLKDKRVIKRRLVSSIHSMNTEQMLSILDYIETGLRIKEGNNTKQSI